MQPPSLHRRERLRIRLLAAPVVVHIRLGTQRSNLLRAVRAGVAYSHHV